MKVSRTDGAPMAHIPFATDQRVLSAWGAAGPLDGGVWLGAVSGSDDVVMVLAGSVGRGRGGKGGGRS